MQETVQRQIERLGIVVIVPTYNNQNTLRRVLDGVLAYTDRIIVVNDGSTDGTARILADYADITSVHFNENQGKGMALRAGLASAYDEGYQYAITIDSDGQHYPSDIPVFVQAIEHSQQPVLWIGSRNMSQNTVPKKSSFGNRFSNFWFWFETGIKLTDTQCGFRAYPLQVIPRHYYTRKFEFEIEIIVRSAWNGVQVKNVPVQVLYDPKERVSHFRPFQDFSRISVLNTVLVFLTFFYILPRNLVRSFKKKSWRDFVKEDIFGSTDSPEKKAASIGLGVFMGIAPVWGFQTVLVITLAAFLRWNKVLAFAFSNISLPPFIPLIVYVSLWTGGLIVPSSGHHGLFALESINISTISSHLVQYLIGSLVLASLSAILVGLVSYVLIKLGQNKVVSTE